MTTVNTAGQDKMFIMTQTEYNSLIYDKGELMRKNTELHKRVLELEERLKGKWEGVQE